MAFPDDPNDLHFLVAFNADRSADPTTWSYDDESDAAKAGVTITRGRLGEEPLTRPTQLHVEIANEDGVFSPRNVGGPHYGELRRNTPVQMAVDVGSGQVPRGTAQVPDWPVRWTASGTDERIALEAAGPLRRLGQGSGTKGAAYRTHAFAAPHGYWSLERDGASDGTVTTLPAGTAGMDPLTVRPPGVMAGVVTGPAGSRLLPEWTSEVASATVSTPPTIGAGASVFTGSLPAIAPAPTSWSASILVRGERVAGSTDPVDWSPLVLTMSDASVKFVDILAGSSTTGASLSGSSGSLASTYSGMPTFDPFDGQWHEIYVTQFQNGGSISNAIYVDGVLVGTGSSGAGTCPYPVGSIGGAIPIFNTIDGSPVDNAGCKLALGHLRIDAPAAAGPQWDVARGYPGETASARVQRNCDEELVFVDVAAGGSVTMGPQPVGTLLDVLEDCENADMGALIERRTGALGFDPRGACVNQSVALTLDYEQGHVTDWDPVDDDRAIVNRSRITRAASGASVTAEQVDGDLGTDPNTGVDVFPEDEILNLSADSQLADYASYRVARGTVDKMRFHRVLVDLIEHPELIDDWLGCDIGSRIVVANGPAEMVGPDDHDLVLRGYQEVLDAVQWYLLLDLDPYDAYVVAIVTDPAAVQDTPRVGSGTAVLAAGLRLPGTAGSYASTPDNAALDIVGDIDLRADVTLDDWTPAAAMVLIAKHTATGNQRSYLLLLEATGLLRLQWSTTGADAPHATSTVAIPVDVGRLAVRATLAVASGTVTFYTASTIDGTWTQLGATSVLGATSIFSSTAVLEVGSNSVGAANLATGIVHAAQVLNGIAGTAVASPDFSAQVAGTTFADAAGRTWTVNGSAAIYAAPGSDDTTVLIGTGDGGSWTTSGADFPLDVAIGGERIRLSAISAAPHVFSVSARSVNGVVKSHSAGGQVEVWQTATVGL